MLADRQLALKWHPDRNPGKREQAIAMFTKIGAAYEILSDSSKRASYNKGGMGMVTRNDRANASSFNFDRAACIFTDIFGDSLWYRWIPGSSLSGGTIRDGRRVTITILPDGTSIEREENTLSRNANYRCIALVPPPLIAF